MPFAILSQMSLFVYGNYDNMVLPTPISVKHGFTKSFLFSFIPERMELVSPIGHIRAMKNDWLIWVLLEKHPFDDIHFWLQGVEHVILFNGNPK